MTLVGWLRFLDAEAPPGSKALVCWFENTRHVTAGHTLVVRLFLLAIRMDLNLIRSEPSLSPKYASQPRHMFATSCPEPSNAVERILN